MFCPLCKAEYREGVTVCADCHIALAPDEISPPLEKPSPDETVLPLWQGDDPRQFARVTQALDSAGIHYISPAQGDFLLYPSLRSIFTVFVLWSDRDAAKKAMVEAGLWEADGEDGSDPPAEVEPDAATDDSPQNAPDDQPGPAWGSPTASAVYPPDDWDPEAATSSVWSGDDAQIACALVDCLRENGIGSVVGDGGGCLAVLVHPEDQDRAGEIVREVVESTPPE